MLGKDINKHFIMLADKGLYGANNDEYNKKY